MRFGLRRSDGSSPSVPTLCVQRPSCQVFFEDGETEGERGSKVAHPDAFSLRSSDGSSSIMPTLCVQRPSCHVSFGEDGETERGEWQ